jgi:hypothetical protein
MANIKIFLSSTFLNLSDPRKKISAWLSGVLGGSDSSGRTEHLSNLGHKKEVIALS